MRLLRSLLLLPLLLAAAPCVHAESNAGAGAAAPAPAAAPAAPTDQGQPAAHPEVHQGGSTQAQPDGKGAQGAPAGSPFSGWFLFVIIGAMMLMLFMSSRKQKAEERRLQDLRSSLKRGDQVVTIGGMHAEVVASGEGTVDLRLGEGNDAPVVRFNKSAIATVAGAEAKK